MIDKDPVKIIRKAARHLVSQVLAVIHSRLPYPTKMASPAFLPYFDNVRPTSPIRIGDFNTGPDGNVKCLS